MSEQLISKPKQRRGSSAKGSKPQAQSIEQDDSDEQEVEDVQKDSDEEELDRLVLGDDAGFLEQLGIDTQVEESGSDSGRGEADLVDEVGLEGVDDADVGANHFYS